MSFDELIKSLHSALALSSANHWTDNYKFAHQLEHNGHTDEAVYVICQTQRLNSTNADAVSWGDYHLFRLIAAQRGIAFAAPYLDRILSSQINLAAKQSVAVALIDYLKSLNRTHDIVKII